MTTLAKYFTLADLRAFSAYAAENPRPEGEYNDPAVNAWYDKMYKHREKAIVGPCMKFFKAKLKAGELKPSPENSHGLNYIEAWNGLALNGEEHLRKWAMDHMEHLFSSLAIGPGCKLFHIEDEEDANVEKIYDHFIEYMDAGNFPWFEVSANQASSHDGSYLSIQFEDWVPVAGKGTRNGFVKVEPVVQKTAPETLQLDFKTGNLVAMDWFRGNGGIVDDAFRQWTKAKGVDDLPSIGNSEGNIKTVRWYADLGIVHVFVGNSSPHVFVGNDMIAVGDNWCAYTADGRHRYSDCDDDGNESEKAEDAYYEAQENPPAGMTDEGSVCTDLWWVTMIERERLEEILVEQLGEEHRGEIKKYVASDFDVNIQVEPGKYTMHFDAHPEEFYPLLDDKKKFCIGTPYFALTKDPE